MIRPLELGDAARLAALYDRNRDFLRPYEPERHDRFFTAEGQRERAAQALDAAREGTLFCYLIVDGSGGIAGTIALSNVVRGASQSATVSYWVDRDRNGEGLATGALAHVVALARAELRLHQLLAPVQIENLASQRVLLKNGFEQIGVVRGFLHVGGAWRDHILYQRVLD